MILIMVILWLALASVLIIVAGIHPRRATVSHFELHRRQAAGDAAAGKALKREAQLRDVVSLRRATVAVLLVLLTALGIVTFGWFAGLVLMFVLAAGYGALSRRPFVLQRSKRLYSRYESSLLGFVDRHQSLLWFIRSAAPLSKQPPKVDSREELEFIVEHADEILAAPEKQLILSGLRFGDQTVRDIMTPRGDIASISKKELLGPLVLDDLHKTGHSRFPVIEEDIDHVVGLLDIQDLLTVDRKRSVTAEKAMEPRVYYIHEEETLWQALAAFLRTHHHLFVVTDESETTVGLLSLEDVIGALLGRKIVDTYDTHDDVRMVAARHSQSKNRSEKRDVA